MKLNKEIKKIISSEVTNFIMKNFSLKMRRCMCGCGNTFTGRTKYHHFYSRSCYSRYHRIPGVVKKIVDNKD